MIKIKVCLICFLLFLVYSGYGQNREFRIYPENNQSVKKQRRDEKQCGNFADQQTRNINANRRNVIDQIYASCLRRKGYQLDIQPRGNYKNQKQLNEEDRHLNQTLPDYH